MWWLKAKSWILNHWKWLLMIVAFAFAYYFGRRHADKFWQQAKDAKENYKKEVEIIEKSRKQEIEDVTTAVEERDKAHVINALRFEKNKRELEEESKVVDIDKFLKSRGIEEK